MELPLALTTAAAPLALWALSAAALPASARAQDEIGPPAKFRVVLDADEARDDAIADRRRLLKLDDGVVLRIRSRFEDGHWQLRDGPEWTDLEERTAARVLEARLETDVLAEGRTRESELGRADHDSRVLLARWMAREGLYPEAISQLDRVLRVYPEHTGALYVIQETPIPLDLPDVARENNAALVRETFLAGARGSQATREVAARRLGELAPIVNVRSVLKAEMTTYQDRRREFALLAARRLFRGELLREVSDRAILDGTSEVRAEAARALRDARDVAVLAPAIHALSSEHSNLRANAAEAMGAIGHPAAVEPLINHLGALAASGGTIGHRANFYLGVQVAYVADYDVEIAQAASIADPVVAIQDSGVVLDARVTVQMTRIVEMRSVMDSLRTLTGTKLGDSPQLWADWWAAQGDAWRSLELSRPETPR